MNRLQAIALIGLGAAVTAASVLPAEAITRLRSDQNSCSTIQNTLQRDGAAVLRYPSSRNPSIMLFDRYVARNTQCRLGQELKRKSVPAADTASCRVYVCEDRQPKFNFEDD